MQRPIKFRAWDEEHKEMVEFDWGGIDDGCCYAGDYIIEDLDEVPVMQFTGLLDKNGVEIYEGDLIKPTYAVTYLYEVYWDDRSNAWRMRSNGEMQFDKTSILSFAKFWEVIGNIYENPELIKV